jgi:very-short-patch-repair endonuclease
LEKTLGEVFEMYKDEKWLRHKIENENMTLKQIGDMFGVTGSTVNYFAKKYGIERPQSTKKKSNMQNSSKCRDYQWLHDQYINQNKSYDEISKEFNIGKTTIGRWVKRHGLAKDELPQHRRKGHHPPVLIKCLYCEEERYVKHAKAKEGNGKFCGSSCAMLYRIATTDVMDKVNHAAAEWRSTPEGKSTMSQNGVKSALSMAGKRTSIEIKMADELAKRGIEYTEQYNLGDKFLLDFFLPEYKIVIECDGDYWHRIPKNVRRDKAKNAYIKACGYSLYRFWESEINEDVEACVDVVLAEINELNVI